MMQRSTHNLSVTPSPDPKVIAAFTRLGDLHDAISTELLSLPTPTPALSEVLLGTDTQALEAQTSVLVQQIDDYWQAPGTQGNSRRAVFIGGMEQGLRDELTVKIHERNLDSRYLTCLPDSIDQSPSAVEAFTLHVRLADDTFSEVNGALVFINDQGLVLAAIPGVGAEGFATRTAMGEALVQWLNNDVLRHALLNNIERYDQLLIETITSDQDLYLESFNITDLQLRPLTDNPFEHAFERQLHKQQSDVLYACLDAPRTDACALSAQLETAISMRGLFGPGAMLEQRDMAYRERQQRKHLPDWIKIASPNDLNQYQQLLTHYELSRDALLSALGGAASHEQFARIRLRARLASDLGYDLEPGQIMVSTERQLPITGESYTVNHSLLLLALYGLHPDDQSMSSAFQTRTTLSMKGTDLLARYPLLTTAYLAELIESLNLNATFGDYQQTTYAQAHIQQLMRDLTRKQVTALAWAAKMQGHIQPLDLEFIQQIERDTSDQAHLDLQVQQIRLNGGDILGNVLIFRKNDAQGRIERLVMFAADAPRARQFQSFDNQTQLLHELVSWTRSPELSRYLLEQVSTVSRPRLETTFDALRLKPHPPSDYVQLVNRPSYSHALDQFVRQHVQVAATHKALRTPAWYLSASHTQRQELLALEETLAGAVGKYQARSHTPVEAFDAYVHRQASKKISGLLGVAEGSVDPDQIIITTEREVLSYTQMLRNGYDDSIGLISSTADTQATFSGPADVDLTPLTPQSVARSVHGKWLSDSYIKLIRETLLNPARPGYDYRRRSSLQVTVLQMKAAALRSYLKGQLDDQEYQWLKLSMEQLHLSDTHTRRCYPVQSLQLRLENALIATNAPRLGEIAKDVYQHISPIKIDLTQIETVQGCYVLSPDEASPVAMIYTPQAPDGKEFRPLNSFKASLAHPGMIDYYKDRCRFEARRKLSFFLRDMAQGGASKPPARPKDAISDFHDTCFNRPLERQLRDVEDTTAGRSDMLANLLWNTVELIATVATLPFPPASFAVGALLSLRYSVLAFQAFADGDQEAASSHILGSLFNSLGAAGDLSAGMKGFGALRKLRQSPSSLRLGKSADTAPTLDDLLPTQLDGEFFWLGKPNANGHAPVYRTSTDAREVRSTGQFAARDSAGKWQPLSKPKTKPDLIAEVSEPPFSVNISLNDAPSLSAPHGQGVRTLSGKCYIELQRRVFEVQFDASTRHWAIVDPNNPFSFFGKRPVKLNDQGIWELRERPGLLGGMDDPFKPLPTARPDAAPMTRAVSQYEVAPELRLHFGAITQTGGPLDTLGMGLEDYFASFYQDMRTAFIAQRESLYHDARKFFNAVNPAPRPTVPALDADIEVTQLFRKIFENNNAIVVGEEAKSIASKRLLIDNMALLAEQDVKILYIQHLLTDAHLEKLEKYRQIRGRSKAGSSELRYWLESLNGGQLNNRSKEYDYYHLIKAAHSHGIEVRPLSSSVSYPLANSPTVATAGDIAEQQKMSNYFAHLVISEDFAAQPERRWVALLDRQLANTHQQVLGIAELHGAVSVRVHDIPSGRPTRISADAEVNSTAYGPADFKIEMANPRIAEPHAAPAPAAIATATPPTRLDMALHKQLNGKPGVNNPYVDKPGFEWTQSSGWQPVDAQRWTAHAELSAIQLSLLDSRYSMPVEMRNTLFELANFEHRGLDWHYFFSDKQQSLVRDSFFNLRKTLQRDARSIIVSELPPRPPMPAVPAQISPADFLDDLYRHTDGVVVGEYHSSVASKKLIIDNLPLLAQQQVKTLYMEHLLSDLHQLDLDHLFDTGHMSKALLHDLRKMDKGHLTDANGVYTYEQLVLRARNHGLEIRAIDCSSSYHLKNISDETPTTRHQMFSYFASRTVRKHQEVMGQHKWIALVGNSHANTYRNIVPGLAELEGGIGLRVADIEPGKAHGIFVDQGEKLHEALSTQTSFIKSDFRVEMEIPKQVRKISYTPLKTIEQRLKKPGMFLLEDGEDGAQVIVHRSRDKAIHRTAVMVNSRGQFYVDRLRWPVIHLKPFDNMSSLLAALTQLNLKQVP